MTQDFDPNAPLIGQDGLEYKDLAAYLQGQPAGTTRNGNVIHYRAYGYREDAVRAYWEAFDDGDGARLLGPSPEFGERHGRGIAAAHATGGFGPQFRWKPPSSSAARAGAAGPVQAQADTVHAAD